jgi:hypothetical protein
MLLGILGVGGIPRCSIEEEKGSGFARDLLAMKLHERA